MAQAEPDKGSKLASEDAQSRPGHTDDLLSSNFV